MYAGYEGNSAVAHRISRDLEKLATESGAASAEVLSNEENDSLGGMLREAFEWLRWGSPAALLYRLSALSWDAKQLSELLRLAANASLRCGILWRAAGILYLAVFAELEDAAKLTTVETLNAQIFKVAATGQGYATVLHAPVNLKSTINVWGETRGDFSLMQRIKKAFDPNEVFARGRFVGGI